MMTHVKRYWHDTPTHTYIHTYIRIHTTYIHAHILHTYVHTYIHTYIHTHIYNLYDTQECGLVSYVLFMFTCDACMLTGTVQVSVTCASSPCNYLVINQVVRLSYTAPSLRLI